jgi:hypothetical protein
MLPLNIEMENPHNIIIDLGYRGLCNLEFRYTDQNGISHSTHFLIDVIGEKPTNFLFSVRDEDGLRVLYALTK